MAKLFREDKPRRLFTKRNVIVAVVLVLLLGTGVFAFFRLGGSSLFGGAVCGKEVIERYNTAVRSKTTAEYNKSVESVAQDVLNLPMHERDANCSLILYTYYVLKDDSVNAIQAVQTFKEQGGDAKVDKSIINPPSAQYMEERVKSLDTKDQPNEGGGIG